MFKYKKKLLYIIMYLYIVLSIIEVIKYMFCSNNLFGIIYLMFVQLIIFFLVPVVYNYNKYFSKQRISKLIIIIILGFISSYLLNLLVINNMSYVDGSRMYNDSIFVIKSILKPLLYSLLLVFTLFEFKLDKLLKKIK